MQSLRSGNGGGGKKTLEASWVAETQLRLNQLFHLDTDLHQHASRSPSSLDSSADAASNEGQAELWSQAQPVEISSSVLVTRS
jgi:hypothetical protein